MKKILTLALALVMLFSLAACGKASITLDKTSHTFTAAGETVTLKAELKKVKELGWTSSDESVATVDANGVVTAVAPGTATITVSGGDVSATCTITCDWQIEVELFDFVVDLADTFGEEFPANMDFAADIEYVYPGFSEISVEQLYAYQPMMSAVVCEIVLVEVANSDDVQAVADIFQTRIDIGSDNSNYPESAEGWKLYAQVQQSGTFVCMIVLPEGYVIPENVFCT